MVAENSAGVGGEVAQLLGDRATSGGRKARDIAFWVLCGIALLFIVAPAVDIVIEVFVKASPVLGWSLLTKNSSTNQGVGNALIGTLALLFGVLVIGGTIGVGGGIWLAEFAPARPARILRFMSEVLSGMPSIVIGYVGFLALVVGLHWGNSLMAAILALSVLVLPYIVRTTEVAVSGVPSALREAGTGMGLHHWKIVRSIILPPAIPGIVSGLIVSLAISTGETAPLLFTAGSTDAGFKGSLFNAPVPYLTYVTFNSRSYAQKLTIGWGAAAVTMVILLILIFLGRLIGKRARRNTERMTL